MHGAGDTTTPMWFSLICNIVLRIPFAYGIAYLTRSAEFPHGEPITLYGSLGIVISIIVFKFGHWKRNALTTKNRASQKSSLSL